MSRDSQKSVSKRRLTPNNQTTKFNRVQGLNGDPLEARNTPKETKIEDSFLLSLFMCSDVMVQHCPRP